MKEFLTDGESEMELGPQQFRIKFDFRDSDQRLERERAPRAKTSIKVRWSWGPVEREGVIRDISVMGCFIATGEQVAAGDAILIGLGIPGLIHMRIEGLVVRRERGEGFGVRFKKMSGTEQALLSHAVRYLQLQSRRA